MGDFVLLLNAPDIELSAIPGLMRHFKDIELREFEFGNSHLYITRPDGWDIWGPYETEDIYVALAGRIAADTTTWDKVRLITEPGGLAAKIIYELYKAGGLKSLEDLNGSYTVIIFEKNKGKLYLINDRCGMFPCFMTSTNRGGLVIGSHPDILARVARKRSMKWDKVSQTEYLITGKVSFPNTYYEDIKALDFGSVHTFDLSPGAINHESRKYFDFKFDIDYDVSQWDLARELANAFRNSLKRRTIPLFGRTGISLSGGLDSRALLCSVDDVQRICTFCFFDDENQEFTIAKQIAYAKEVEFIPLRRKYDHYGDNAESGVKISGGMGDFVNNHYLGFRDKFHELGIKNIIAGFYCDYLFKSLVLNKKKNKYLRTERFSEFEFSNYMPVFWFNTQYSKQVKERLDLLFPDDLKKDESDHGRLEIEKRRLFPFYSEPDNMETTIPQRIMGWYLPIVDNDIIDTYLKIRPDFKLNTSMYSKTVAMICGDKISRIKNSNTGAPVNANQATVMIHGLANAAKSKLRRKKKSISTNESWPNWQYYIQNSNVIESLWMRNKNSGEDFLSELIGYNPYCTSIRDYAKPENMKLFFRLLTLKIWSERNS